MPQTLANGKTVEELVGEEGETVQKRFFVCSDGAMRLQPGGWLMPKNFLRYVDLIYNFEVRPSDVFVCAFPKSGTTWVQEMVWTMMHNPDLDNPDAKISMDIRFHNLESDIFLATTGVPPPDEDEEYMQMFKQLFPDKTYLDGLLIHLASKSPKQRMFKTHLPIELLPKKTLETVKVVYVAREPRDTLASFYHYARLQILIGFDGDLDQYVDDVVNDRVPFSPYFNHLKSAWDQKDDPNMLILFYEDLKEDALKEIKKIDKFFGTERTEEQLQNIYEYTKFENMKERGKDDQPTSHKNILFDPEVQEKEGGFFRKGQVGDWKNRFTPEQTEKLNAWMAKKLPQFGEDFKYKI